MRLNDELGEVIDSKLHFEVSEVEFPVISVAFLNDSGFNINFSHDQGCRLEKGGKSVALVREG